MGAVSKYPVKRRKEGRPKVRQMTRLKAATILETMVALSILVVIFGIAITFFIRAGAASMSLKKLEAAQLLKDFSEDTRRLGEFADGERRVDGFTLRRRVMEMTDRPRLWQIHYFVYDRDERLLQDWQQLVLEEAPTGKQ